jgi:hypothetical protein
MTSSETSDLLPSGCGLWISWLFASIFGGLLGWWLGWRASFLIPGFFSTVTLGLFMGLVLGALQWLVLRSHLNGAGWWVPASGVGWGLGFTTGVLLAQQFGLMEVGFGLSIGLTTGLCLGIFQWMVLKGNVSKAGVWVPVNIFAWGTSLVFYRPGSTALGAYIGTLSGMVTGLAMLWLIYRPIEEEATVLQEEQNE